MKLIEAALPLHQIDAASLRENQGRVSPLQLWWSRKPGAACRAVLAAALLDDPGEGRRAELLRVVGRVAEGHGLAEVRRLLAGSAPAVLDPFCGAGSIAAEARRLGLASVSGDLNPVAVLATRALVSYPARFPGRDLPGDIRRSGRLLAEEARRRIGAAYPEVEGEPPVAWVWARTTSCPACGQIIPLAHSFVLSTRPGREARVEGYPAEGTVSRRGVRCLACGTLTPLSALARRGLGPERLLATVLTGRRYLPPEPEQEAAAHMARPPWAPETELPARALGLTAARYGLKRHRDLHTPRQLLALATFADLVRSGDIGLAMDGGELLHAGGTGERAYAEAVRTYLGLALARAAARWCTFARWQRSRENVEHAFGRPGLAMAWDFAEANPFATGAGGWVHAVDTVARALESAPREGPAGACLRLDAAEPPDLGQGYLVCTDPPYLDTLPYADMADIFYVWLRPALAGIHPDLLAAPLTPKAGEIVADASRLGGPAAARATSRARLGLALAHLRRAAHPDHPLVLFYGMKATEDWETLLEALLAAELRVTAAWPVRTEHGERLRRLHSMAMGCTIVLCCRARATPAPEGAWAEVSAQMRSSLAEAVPRLVGQGVTPVDLPQAALGAALAVFTRFARVTGAPPLREVLATVGEAVEQEVLDALDPPARACAAAYAGGTAPGASAVWTDLHTGRMHPEAAMLAHCLHAIAIRRGWREDALRYNDAVSAWRGGLRADLADVDVDEGAGLGDGEG